MLDLAQFLHRVVEQVVPVDCEIQEDEPLDAVVEVDVVEERGQAVFHVLPDAHFLLVDGLDLDEFVLVVEGQQERVVDEVEVLQLVQVDLQHLHRLEESTQKCVVKGRKGHSGFLLVALIQQFHVVTG